MDPHHNHRHEPEPKAFFTPNEVNALIPRMEDHFQNFWSHRQSAQDILDELRGRDREEPDSTARDIAHIQMRKSQAHFLLELAKKELDAVEDLGGTIKDLELGLVDFNHLLDSDEEVCLCWKVGEKKVRFWHELDEGFSSRKPLSRRLTH